MEEAIKIVKNALASVRGKSEWGDGAKYVLEDVLKQLEAAQKHIEITTPPSLIKSYRIEWLVPKRHSAGIDAYWSEVATFKEDALYWLDWWREQQPDDQYRLIQITETVIDPGPTPTPKMIA